jgi:hypothetical protein
VATTGVYRSRGSTRDLVLVDHMHLVEVPTLLAHGVASGTVSRHSRNPGVTHTTFTRKVAS